MNSGLLIPMNVGQVLMLYRESFPQPFWWQLLGLMGRFPFWWAFCLPEAQGCKEPRQAPHRDAFYGVGATQANATTRTSSHRRLKHPSSTFLTSPDAGPRSTPNRPSFACLVCFLPFVPLLCSISPCLICDLPECYLLLACVSLCPHFYTLARTHT